MTGTIVLRNDLVSASILPQEGARVSSLKSVKSEVEFLAQPYRRRSLLTPSLSALFEHGSCAGIEECLPSVGPCGADTDGGAVPDHGDFWQLEWQVASQAATALSCFASGFSRSIRFEKHFQLHENTLEIHYIVRNVGPEDTSFLYSCHPLLAIEPGDHICLPADVSPMTIDYSYGEKLGRIGDEVFWPYSGDGTDLRIVRPESEHQANMLYTNRLSSGICGLYRSSYRQGLLLHFDVAALPYLGVWLCYGGWPHPPQPPLQYAVALEPTHAPVNTLVKAQKIGLAKFLKPQQTFEWELRFEIGAPGMSLEEFWPH